MMMRLLIVLILAVTPVISLNARERLALPRPNDPKIIGDRLHFTQSALSVPKGTLQLETGYTATVTNNRDTHDIGEILFRLGVMKQVELRFGIGSWIVENRETGVLHGKDEPSLEMKVQFLQAGGVGKARPDLSIIIGSPIPVGSQDIIESAMQPGSTAAFGWPVTERLDFGINIGFTYAADGTTSFYQFHGSAVFEVSLSDTEGIFLEYYAIYPGSRAGPMYNFIDGGVTWLALPRLQFDLRAGYHVASSENEWYIGIGLVWMIPGLF